ncbi:MAG: ABC transporter ATP-binding protein [Cellulosilyticaceae bacterium]
MEKVFECVHLTKKYGGLKVLDHVNLTLKKGHIYGLVGNNGAGKTTLMRIMMGLAFPTNGEIMLFGESKAKKITANRRRIGAMIEHPVYISTMSGRRNLELLATLYGIKDKQGIEEALLKVNLTHKADVCVKNYSLGMKQRLGLAGALLGDPEFLILDEPTNGLDPSGIKEIRESLVEINRQTGLPMLISSHYLEQLNMLATDFIILHEGKVVSEFTDQELAQKCKSYIVLEVKEQECIDEAIKGLQKADPNMNIEVMPTKQLHIFNFMHSIHTIPGIMALAGIEIKKLESVGVTFEDYFSELIGGKKDA